ncbi:MAG: hypothetical protein JRI71_10180 [Deltaproteobacteria bacterium]|nr:hypothetical protein [Deltaproteobacteria bacterium]
MLAFELMFMAFDVLRAKYYPEKIVDPYRMDITTEYTEVMRQVSFDPYVLFLESIAVDSGKDVNVQVIIDGSEIATNDAAASGGLDEPMVFHQLVQSSLVINAKSNTAGVISDVPFRIVFTVDKLAPYDKVFYGEFISKRLRAQAKEYGIQARTLAGIQSKISSHRWLYTREISKSFTGLSTNQNPTVGTIVDVPYVKDINDNIIETKVVLLGVSCERAPAIGDRYISITRGENEEDYIQMDCRVASGLAYWEDLFIPARDRMDIIYKNGTITYGKIKFRYGIAPLNIRDKIKWGIPLADFEEDAITSLKTSESIDVYEMMEVGLL